MDKQLLQALDNLSVGLEKLSEALEKGQSKSNTGQALEAGNFGKSLESINTQLKSIKKDTQEILKNQQTIIAISKKKSESNKTQEVEDAGGGKKEGAIKKGVTTILLIAVAVLAIGLAFKIVGKINFLSVIGLSAAIWVMSLAFERIAKLGLTIKEAAIASLTMVLMATGVTISSFILSKVSKVGFMQLFTAGAIILMFALSADKISLMMRRFSRMGIMALVKGIVALPIVMVAVSWGIAKSSHILKGVTPISFMQALTAIFIAGVFTVISFGLPKLIKAVGKISIWNVLTGKAPKIALVMAAVAIGITESSRYMQRIMPIGFSQAITAILIAGMFTVISYGIVNITKALGKVTYKDMLLLPTMLTLMALGIALSAYIFYKAKPYIDGIGFLTSLRILLLGVTIGAIAIVVAFALKIMGDISWKKVLQVPAFFTLMATAIAASAFILSKAKAHIDNLGFMTILKILLIGAALGIITLIVAFTSKILGNISWGQVAKIPTFYTLIATAIAASAFILSKAKSSFDKMTFEMMLKIAVFGIVVAIAVAAMGLVVKLYKMLGIGVKDAVKGGIAIVAIATVIMISSLILNVGKYNKYPTLKWVLGVGAALGAFGIAAILLGTQTMNPFFYAGLGITLLVAGTIVAASHILNAGKYNKYPTFKWNLGVSAALASFGLAAIILGTQAINPFFYAGLGITALVAITIVEVADILAKGKYNLPGLAGWAASVALLYTMFTPLIILLGGVGAVGAVIEFFGGTNPFEAGRGMLKDIAWSIVDVSLILQKGVYKQGPTEAWAKGISIALGAFAPVYQMLVSNAVMSALGGGGIGPDDFTKAIKTVSRGIVAAAWFFANNKAAFLNGPPVKWAKGVGAAIGAFAPVFVALNENTGWFSTGTDVVNQMVYGVIAISKGVVAAADIFAKNKATFDEGYPSAKWGKGVGAALAAFNPVFKSLHEDTGWFTSGEEVIDQMRYGIVTIAGALSDAAWAFSFVSPDMWKAYPSDKWAKGVSAGVQGFMDLFDTMEERGYSATFFSIKSALLMTGANAMAKTAKILYTNKKYFTVKLDPNFIKNISINILGFAKLAFTLDKMLVTEKTVTSTNSGILGIGGSTTTKTVRERRDLGLVKDVAIQMTSMAAILWTGRKFFGLRIDPNYMKNVGKNILDFNFVVKKLAEAEKGSSIFGRVGSAVGGLFGNDPVSQVTRRMLMLAKGYDAIATALIKLGSALKLLNIKNLQQLGAITKGLAGTGQMPGGEKGVRPPTLKTYGFSATKDKRSVGVGPDGQPIRKFGKSLDPNLEKKNQIYYVSQQLEKVVKLLASIDASTSTIDDFIALQTKNKLMAPPPIMP
jgi:hypothetical protein